ncbi:MAG: hypothetical protein HY674_10130 [Chloroflexi bacterium]|nr:hypothetical protein [Chloroflexota bacterium]
MKLFPMAAVFWGACLTGALGQISVEVAVDQEQFLPNESLVLRVRISNFSGQTLSLGKAEDWLSFTVEAKDNFVVKQVRPVPVAGEFTLESSSIATKRVDLAPCFDLTKSGRYSVTATVKIPDWNRAYSSQPKTFDISLGAKLWEAAFGVPEPAGEAKGSPEVRKYVLQQAVNLKGIRLYFRLTDASESRTFRVFPIGALVSFSHPEPQLDTLSNLHVLFQNGARTFSYCVINPEGILVTRETHEYTTTRPVLRAGPDGKIMVEGGARRTTSDDLPPPAAPTPSADAKPTSP